MRGLRSKLALLSVLAATGVACAPPAPWHQRQNVPTDQADDAEGANAGNQKITVHGNISTEGSGSTENRMAGPNILKVAKKVDISALGKDGALVPVATADVKEDGTFDASVQQEQSPTGLFIVEAKDVADAVVGSAVLNGISAFAYGFLVDVPMDTLTSFKTEILTTIARGGTPGIQNFVNVLDTFLDSELAGIIVTSGAFVQDFTTILSTTSDALISAVNVLEASLAKVGLPIDLSALTNAQAAVVSGIVKLTNGNNSKAVSSAKQFLAGLQAATAKAASPVDEALFNAVVTSGSMFNSKMKSGMPSSMKADVDFAVSKSLFRIQTETSSVMTEESFSKSGIDTTIMDVLKKATDELSQRATDAKTPADLEAAKAQFKSVLLGQNDSPQSIIELLARAVGLGPLLDEIRELIAPVAENLAGVLLAPFDATNIGDALTKFDADMKSITNTLMKKMGENEAKALAGALTRIEKVVPR